MKPFDIRRILLDAGEDKLADEFHSFMMGSPDISWTTSEYSSPSYGKDYHTFEYFKGIAESCIDKEINK